jgi:OTU domain-containing protein 6
VTLRHKKELKDMEYNNRKRMKEAKSFQGKGQQDRIAEAETQNLRDEDELRYRQQHELQIFEDSSTTDLREKAEVVEAVVVIEDKKAKAAKKKEKEREKERLKAKEKQVRMSAEKAEAGPSPRDVELGILSRKLSSGVGSPIIPPLRVHEVLSDGHCLYRAVDHQLQLRRVHANSGDMPLEQVVSFDSFELFVSSCFLSPKRRR